jgi:hypothetical protein
VVAYHDRPIGDQWALGVRLQGLEPGNGRIRKNTENYNLPDENFNIIVLFIEAIMDPYRPVHIQKHGYMNPVGLTTINMIVRTGWS